MEYFEHLPLPEYGQPYEKKKGGSPRYTSQEGRDRQKFYDKNIEKAIEISKSLQELKQKYKDKIEPNLIYKLVINQKVNQDIFEKALSMGIQILASNMDKGGYLVVFSSEKALEQFKNKLAQYSGIVKGSKYDFFNAIESLQDIAPHEKIGSLLKQKPLLSGSPDYINIELWRMDDDRLNKFIEELKAAYDNLNEFRISDKLITRSFVLLRVKLTDKILGELLELKEIAFVDRPFIPSFRPSELHSIDISEFNIAVPPDNAAGILIIDSGIVSNHPLLENAVGGEENYQEGERETHDTVGHGTAVSGCALYGDIDRCIADRNFVPSNFLFSAKVMYKHEAAPGEFQAVFDPEKLLESQLDRAIRDFLDNVAYKIRVVNISFGNEDEIWDKTTKRQFPMAALIDELAFDYPHVVFVISAGNKHPKSVFYSAAEILDNYPNYLTDNPEFKIINPATSALALTVGSIASDVRIINDGNIEKDIWQPVAKTNAPSPFTRSGFGVNDMIKPEVVEYGGNMIIHDMNGHLRENSGGNITLLSNNPTEKLFTFKFGTSFSAPKIAHLAGRIANSFPNRSANFIKNLTLLSADYPFSENSQLAPEKQRVQIEGYGLPNFERAVHSFNNRVVLFNEGEIGYNKIRVFSLNIPPVYSDTKGNRKIIVTLTFNPPTRSTRGDSYLSNRMNFYLYHSVSPDEIIKNYAAMDLSEDSKDNDNGLVPKALKKNKLETEPLATARKAGCHQKAWVKFKTKPLVSPISLVLINSLKWQYAENYMQQYCVSVIFEHSESIEMYNLIRNDVQLRIRLGGQV